MDEQIIISLWRKYITATHANIVSEWKKYFLACLRANVFPATTRGLDVVGFVDAIHNNSIKTADESGEVENEHA